MPLELNLVLYHCNDEKRCLKFLDSDTYMIISNEDGRWLGQRKKKLFWKESYVRRKLKMKINKDLDFLDQLENAEIEKLRLIYKEEMEKSLRKQNLRLCCQRRI